MKDQASQDPIVLGIGETAEPNTCGSCYKFERREPWNGHGSGYCTMNLPPHYARAFGDAESRPKDSVNDDSSCDLYRHSGKAYIVSKLVKP